MKHPLDIQCPFAGNQIMQTHAALRREFYCLADGLLSLVFVGVIVYDPDAPLDIRDDVPVRLNEVVTEQAGYPTDIIPEALEDDGIGNLDQTLPVPPERAFLRAGCGQHPAQPQVGLGIIKNRAVFRETGKRKQGAGNELKREAALGITVDA